MKRTFELASRVAELEPLLDEVESLLLGEGLPKELALEIRLVAEEGISNIIHYAHEGGREHRIEVSLSSNRKGVRIELRDDGRPFNPIEAPSPDLNAPLEARPDGGLGIHLMRTLTDEMSYRREGGRNVLVLKKRL